MRRRHGTPRRAGDGCARRRRTERRTCDHRRAAGAKMQTGCRSERIGDDKWRRRGCCRHGRRRRLHARARRGRRGRTRMAVDRDNRIRIRRGYGAGIWVARACRSRLDRHSMVRGRGRRGARLLGRQRAYRRCRWASAELVGLRHTSTLCRWRLLNQNRQKRCTEPSVSSSVRMRESRPTRLNRSTRRFCAGQGGPSLGRRGSKVTGVLRRARGRSARAPHGDGDAAGGVSGGVPAGIPG